RDAACVGSTAFQSRLTEQKTREHPVHDAQPVENDSTHCLTGTRGMTRSTRIAAVSAMRLAPHEGHNPRRLHENATSFSCAHSLQRTRRKPCARMPHSRYASNSSWTNCGKLDPVCASTCARK